MSSSRNLLFCSLLALGLMSAPTSADAGRGSRPAAAKKASTAKPSQRRTKRRATKAKPGKLGRAVRSAKAKVQSVSPRSLGMFDRLRLGPGSSIVNAYAKKQGWTKLDRTGASTHVVAVHGGKATFKDASGKSKTVEFTPDGWGSTVSSVPLHSVPPNTRVRFEVNVVASTDGGRSFSKRPQQPLVFETVIP